MTSDQSFGDLPADFAERIAELWSGGAFAGYLRPRLIELYRKRQPPRPAIDLDVILYQPDGVSTFIDFAIPYLDQFIGDAGQGELSLNGITYSLRWLEPSASAQVIQSVFEPPL